MLYMGFRLAVGTKVDNLGWPWTRWRTAAICSNI